MILWYAAYYQLYFAQNTAAGHQHGHVNMYRCPKVLFENHDKNTTNEITPIMAEIKNFRISTNP